MFKGKQIKYLTETTNKLTERADKQEKLITEIKESLDQMTSEDFSRFSAELKDFNERVGKSSESLAKVQSDLGELSTVTKQIAELKQSITENMTTFQNYRNELNNSMDQLKKDFSETSSTVTTIKDELIEERNKVVESNEKLVKQEVMLSEKISQVEKFDGELREARAMLGKLEEQRDSLEKELIETKTSRDLQYKELTKIRDEYSKYKKDNEDQFAFGASVRKLLDTTIEGKIILELRSKSPQTIDSLAEKLNETAVKAKQSINTLRDLGIVKVDEETRSVSL